MGGIVYRTGGPYPALLRQEITARNVAYAARKGANHVTSYGEMPIVVYPRSECGRYHGNFVPAAYRAIVKRPDWERRLQKAHSQGKSSLPRGDSRWRELDSSMSSDALLMNIFCYPGVLRRPEVCRVLGIERGEQPEFGYRPRIPLLNRQGDRTEIDMRLGSLLCEAKLTETDFQIQSAKLVEHYRDFQAVFDCQRLPRKAEQYLSYQLIRNVLAAYALDLRFCVLLDARRPDLLQDWYDILSCVGPASLRTRCMVLTWQELSGCLPTPLRRFLDDKYGIVPAS